MDKVYNNEVRGQALLCFKCSASAIVFWLCVRGNQSEEDLLKAGGAKPACYRPWMTWGAAASLVWDTEGWFWSVNHTKPLWWSSRLKEVSEDKTGDDYDFILRLKERFGLRNNSVVLADRQWTDICSVMSPYTANQQTQTLLQLSVKVSASRGQGLTQDI